MHGSFGSLILLDVWFSWMHNHWMQRFSWIHGSPDTMVILDPWFSLDLWFSWIHGSPGSMVLLDAWFSWIHGMLDLWFSRPMAILDPWLSWIHGSPGSTVLLDPWLSWIYNYLWSMVLLDPWFSWIHSFTECMALLDTWLFVLCNKCRLREHDNESMVILASWFSRNKDSWSIQILENMSMFFFVQIVVTRKLWNDCHLLYF